MAILPGWTSAVGPYDLRASRYLSLKLAEADLQCDLTAYPGPCFSQYTELGRVNGNL